MSECCGIPFRDTANYPEQLTHAIVLESFPNHFVRCSRPIHGSESMASNCPRGIIDASAAAFWKRKYYNYTLRCRPTKVCTYNTLVGVFGTADERLPVDRGVSHSI